MGQLFVELADLLNHFWPYPKYRWVALIVIALLVCVGIGLFVAEWTVK